ncbi:MAG: type II toxin-antitoxin system RelE/ParE family toxin [Phycisphaerae bacterium]
MSGGGGYTVRIKRSAEKEMNRLVAKTFERITKVILNLESNPRPARSKKLRGMEDYRLRVGQHRILYSIDDRERTVEIIAVGHRRDVYRGI